MEIMLFSKWRKSAILSLRKLQCWSRGLYRHVILHLHSKFRVDRSIWRRDITKKRFSIWPKGTSLAQCTCTKCKAVTIHPPARLVRESKKTKKRKARRKEGRKEERHPDSGKLAIRPDHPRRRIKIKLCMVGGLRCVVIHVKCDPNRSRGYGAVGVENGPFLLLWPVAYTTACTTVYKP